MKIKYCFTFGFIALFASLIASCASSGLVTKSYATRVELNKVNEIGTNKGEIAPDFAVLTTENKPIILGDFTRNKKPVIIYFFTTWCPYCHQDLTALSKVYKNYENDVGIIAIDIDPSEDSKKNKPIQNSVSGTSKCNVCTRDK